MAGSNTFGGTIKLEGEREYRQALSQINSDLKVLGSEMGKVTAEYGKNSTSTQGLTDKNKVLTDQIDKQKEKVSLLQGALSKSTDQYGESDKKTQNWQVSLNKAEAQLTTMQKELDGNNKALEEGGDASQENAKGLDEFGNSAEDAGQKTLTFGDLVKANLISTAIISGIKALGGAISDVGAKLKDSVGAAAAYGDNILVMSQTTGVSAETLQEFNAISELTDVSMDTLSGSMSKNIKSMQSAMGGTGAAAEGYKKLGVSVKDSHGNMRDGEDVWRETIVKLGNMTNETERDAMAMQLLGKSAKDLNPIIEMDGESFSDLVDTAYQMGSVLSDDVLNSLGDMDDSFQIWGKTMESTSNLVGAAFAPAVTDIMQGANFIAGSFNNMISAVVNGGDISAAVDGFVGTVTNMIDRISEAVPQLLQMGSTLITTLAQGISQALPALLPVLQTLIPQIIDTLMGAMNQLIPVAMQIIMALIQGIIAALPALISGAAQLISGIVSGIAAAIPTLLPAVMEIIMTIVGALYDNIPMLLDAGIKLLLALVDAIPPTIESLLNALPDLIDKVINYLITSIPLLIDGAIKLFMAIVMAIPKIIVTLVDKLPDIIISIITQLTKPSTISMLIQAAIKLFMALVTAIPTIIVELGRKLPEIVNKIVGEIDKAPGRMLEIGKNIVTGLWDGISGMIQWVKNKIMGFADSVTGWFKNFFGIASPSKIFRDQVGKNLALGLGGGFIDQMPDISKDMAASIPTNFAVGVTPEVSGLSGVALSSVGGSDQGYLVAAFQKALSGMAFMIDDEKMGEMMISKVEKVVYA